MKQLVLLVACVAVLTGCSSFRREKVVVRPAPVKVVEPALVDENGTPIERIPFRPGVSSTTVENLAKKLGCVGGQGAGLTTEAGPVETYRMLCDNRKVLVAKCELRQCRIVR